MRIQQDHLTQLLFGYVSTSNLIAEGQLKAPRRIHEQLAYLFPAQVSQMFWSDRF